MQLARSLCRCDSVYENTLHSYLPDESCRREYRVPTATHSSKAAVADISKGFDPVLASNPLVLELLSELLVEVPAIAVSVTELAR